MYKRYIYVLLTLNDKPRRSLVCEALATCVAECGRKFFAVISECNKLVSEGPYYLC